MKLSFVIPAYNEEHYIDTCLEAIEKAIANRHEIEVIEVIVANNASTDRTAEFAAARRGVVVVHETKPGPNSARQAGFLKARGEYIAFIDADTLPTSQRIDHIYNEFKNSDIVCVSGPYVYYDLPRGINFLVRIFEVVATMTNFLSRIVMRRSSVVQGGNFAVRKSA